MARLLDCEYLPENDFDYLRNDDDWIERMRAKALNDYEVGQLKKLMTDLQQCGMGHINDLFAIGPLKFYFTKADFSFAHRANLVATAQSPPIATGALPLTAPPTNGPGTASQDKFQVKAAFIATIVRFLVIKEEDLQLANKEREDFLIRYPFLQNEIGTSIELTWLNRFERSLRYLKKYMPPERNKILFLTVGNHLEGSTLYTTYITGGANRPETERRVKIFDLLCQVQPRKRNRKPDVAASTSSSSLLEMSCANSGSGSGGEVADSQQLPQQQAAKKTKKDYNSIAKEKRQYNKMLLNKLKLTNNPPSFINGSILTSNLLPKSSSYSHLSLGDSMPSLERKRSNDETTTISSLAYPLSRQSSFESCISSENIPYELSVLLQAVETQIREDDIDVDDDDDDEDHNNEEDYEKEFSCSNYSSNNNLSNEENESLTAAAESLINIVGNEELKSVGGSAAAKNGRGRGKGKKMTGTGRPPSSSPLSVTLNDLSIYNKIKT